MPYAETYAAREAFSDQTIAAPADVLAAQVAAARSHVARDVRWVVTAHAFVEGGAATLSERPLTMVGGIETVPSAVFEGASYVALGHLHRPQAAGAAHVRYCGAWMGFGFDEAGETRSLELVEIDQQGGARRQAHPLTPKRPLKVLTGQLSELVRQGREWPPEERQGLIKAVLTDEGALFDPMGQLRSVFPYVLQLERQRRVAPDRTSEPRAINRNDYRKVISSFLEVVRGAGPDGEEARIVNGVLHDLQTEAA